MALGNLAIFPYDQRGSVTHRAGISSRCSTIPAPQCPPFCSYWGKLITTEYFFTQLKCVGSNRSKMWDSHYSFSQPQAPLIRLCEIAFQGTHKDELFPCPEQKDHGHWESWKCPSFPLLGLYVFQSVTSFIRPTETPLYFPPRFPSTLLDPHTLYNM